MKTILKFILAFISLTSCYAQQEKMELNLTKGQIYTQNVVSSISTRRPWINSKKVNMDVAMNTVTRYSAEYKVINIQNSVYEMEVQYKRLIMTIIYPEDIQVDYSSGDKNGSEQDFYSTILDGMKNKSFLVKITKNGKIVDLKNIESIFSNMFKKYPQFPDTEKQFIRNQLIRSFGEKAFRRNLESITAIFPDSPVSKTDKWTVTTKLETGIGANISTTYKLEEVDDLFYFISGVSRINTTNKDTNLSPNDMFSEWELNGSMHSDLKINKKSGWVTEGIINETVKGSAHLKNDIQWPETETIPITIIYKITTK